MKIIDISRVSQEAPLYPGNVPFERKALHDMRSGDLFNDAIYTFNSHIGTHADAPRHFVADGKGMEAVDLARFFGPCRVVAFPENTLLGPSHLEGKVEGCARLVIKAGGGSYLSPEGAEYLLAKGVISVTTDAFSIAPLDNAVDTHRILLEAEMGIIESVDLVAVEEGEYILCAFPIKIAEGDGAPVRAVLLVP